MLCLCFRPFALHDRLMCIASPVLLSELPFCGGMCLFLWLGVCCVRVCVCLFVMCGCSCSAYVWVMICFVVVL